MCVHYLGFIMLMENSVIRTVVPGAMFLYGINFLDLIGCCTVISVKSTT